MINTNTEMTLKDLVEYGKKNPKFNSLCTGLGILDATVHGFVKEIITNNVSSSEVDMYYIKTGYSGQLYNVYLFYKPRQVTIGYSFMMADFLNKCSSHMIDEELNIIINKMIDKSLSKNVEKDKINWVL